VYSKVSAEVHEVLLSFSPQIEPLALDEAFVDVSGSLHFYRSPGHLAWTLKQRVKQETHLNVSVGMGPNKLVAKLACSLGKPNGLKVVRPSEVRALLDPLPVRKLWGVGPVMASRLGEFGVQRIGQLAAFNPTLLAELLGDHALELQQRARGEDDSPVVSDRVPKSYGEENTFEADVLDRETVSATLVAHAEAVACRLRKKGHRGRTVTLKIKLGRRRGSRVARNPDEAEEPIYPVLTRSRTLASATDDGRRIAETALLLWDEARVEDPVRLLGVTLTNLISATEPEQLELFGERQKADRLGPTLDRINERFGKRVIGRAIPEPEKTTPSLHRRD
jgi:DNA polymerase IV